MHRVVIVGLLFASFCLLSGCAPVFSDLQSAKLVGPGGCEFTPSVSTVSFSNEGETEKVQTHVGFQAAVGLNEKTDLRIRYEHIALDLDGDDTWSANVLGFGPKFALTRDKSAFYVPIGLAFGSNVDDPSKTWAVHPTLLYTHQMSPGVELNPSAKVLIPLNGEDSDLLVAFNLGAGLSSDPDKWILRPEVGFLFNPDGDGHFMHFSLGMSFYP